MLVKTFGVIHDPGFRDAARLKEIRQCTSIDQTAASRLSEGQCEVARLRRPTRSGRWGLWWLGIAPGRSFSLSCSLA